MRVARLRVNGGLPRFSTFAACAIPVLLVLVALGVASCGRSSSPKLSERVIPLGQPVPKGGGVYKVGKPYQINGRWYRPRENPRYNQVGTASWYGELFHGRRTANGEIFDMTALTAAHPTLPMPTYARVTNLNNGRTIVVRVNDRGPFARNRVIDLSRRSAELLGFRRQGTAPVRVTYLGRAPLNGDDRYERRVLASQPWARRLAGTRPASRRRFAQAADPIVTGSLPNQTALPMTEDSGPWADGPGGLNPASPALDPVFVQAGSFRNLDNAERLGTALADLGPVAIDPVRVGEEVFHRVRIGPFDDHEEAQEALERAIAAGAVGPRLTRN